MSDRYKLVFRGEVLDGQHPAVVRKRLATAAGFADAALDKLFSGQPVVVKRDADTATAAKLQVMFKQAGARLRVLPVEEADAAMPAQTAAGKASAAGPGQPARPRPAAASSAAAPAAAATGTADADLELLPPGSDVLRESERRAFEPRDVDTGDLKLEGARFAAPEARSEPPAPDVSHLSVAEVGVDLGPGRAPTPAPVSVPELDVAAVGADLSTARVAPAPVIDVNRVSFEVAPAGSELGQRKPAAAPPPPDTSHLDLESIDRD